MQGVNSVSGNSSTSFSTLASAQASLVSTTATTNTTNASKMLEAALQQMDGIISSATTTTATTATDTTNNSYTESFTSLQIPTYTEATQSGVNSNNGKKGIETRTTTAAAAAAAAAASSNHEENTIFSNNMESLTLQICNLTKELAIIIKQLGITAPPPPDASSACIIADWLERHVPHPNVDERMRSLQHDKDALTLQYQLLADRVHEQANKIIELEGLLTERTQQLSLKEDMLQRQLLTASALETQKLEFISALSELKLHRATLGRNALELTDLDTSINTNKSYGFAGSVGNLQNYDDANPNFSAASNATNADELIVANNMNIWGKNQQQQFHSLPRARGSKNFNNNNNNNNNNSNSNISLNNKKNVWLQQQQQQQQQNDKNNNKKKNNNNNNNNNNSAIDANNENVDCVCATTNSTNMLQKQRNVAFASNENIIDENPQLLQYLQQSLSRPSALTQQDHTPTTTIATTASPTLRERSAKGLRQILGKLRRSNSGNLELPMLDQTDVEFKRGGARATAAGRIERSKPISGTGADHVFIPNKAWADWSPPEICNWIADLQLGCYVNDCRKWLESNPSVNFFNATPEEIEKELNIKVPLHRKKIQYALDELTGREKDELALKAGKLDVGWVLRWLDDIGLPQYKESFLQAKLDGRMLHRLTMEDLASLHISSCLHIASLRRGIQIMREKEWNPDSLIRRSLKMVPSNPTTANDDEATNETSLKSNQTIECVALWTAFRVMEWLRVVDLSEYAPNLRGAGVHGALMLYEPRFNADLLADLLSIPPSKTLLRRHLATHFKELLGRDVIVAKRDTESLQGFQPLTITAKLKPLKKTQFSLKRRKSMKATENANCIGLISNAGLGTNRGSNEFDWSAFVCPMEQRVLNE